MLLVWDVDARDGAMSDDGESQLQKSDLHPVDERARDLPDRARDWVVKQYLNDTARSMR